MESGIIFNIQRFSVHDGPGIRTNIFFKGCPLRCAWCHNPEGWSSCPEISYLAHRCIGCGACAACPQGVHSFAKDAHRVNWAACVGCGACADACAYGALELQGKRYSADELCAIAERDRLFYGEVGGVTLTGGEPMMQASFAITLAARLHSMGIGVCVETSGFAAQSDFAAILPHIDRFLFDIKETDEANHEKFTGVGMAKIRENLRFLDDHGAKIVLRCPIIPEVNLRESHFRALAALANELHHVCGIDLEPYHPLGISKVSRIGHGVPYTRQEPLDRAELEPWAQKMLDWTSVPVRAYGG